MTSSVVRPGALPDSLRALYPFGPHHVAVEDGLRMHYLDEGRGKEVALLLHGNPTWSFLYRNVVPDLKPRFRVIAPDFVGFGLSDKPTDPAYYTLERHIRNLETFAEALDLRDVTLVVHDWGGPIGMGWATRHAERVKRVVVLNTWAFAPPPSGAKIPLALSAFREPALGNLLGKRLNLFVNAIVPLVTASRLPRRVMQGYRFPHPTPESREGILAFPRMIPLSESDASFNTMVEIERRLPELKDRPARIVWALKDPVFRKAMLNRWRETFPRAGDPVLLPGANHFLQEDAPREIATEILRLQREKP